MTPASASAACVTSTISDSISLPSCLPNLLCAQPTMHPLMLPSKCRSRTIASPLAPLYLDIVRKGFRHQQLSGRVRCLSAVFLGAELSRAKLAFADHALVAVHFVLDPVLRAIALSKEQTDNFVAAFGRLVDAPIRKKFHCLADAIFVF